MVMKQSKIYWLGNAMFYFLAFNSANALTPWRNEWNLKAMFEIPGVILPQDLWLDAK